MDKIIIDANLQKPFQTWDIQTIDSILMIYKYNDTDNYYNIVLNKFKEYIEWRKFNEPNEYNYKLKNLINTYLLISKSLILYNQVNYYEIYDTINYTSIIDSFLNMTTDTVFFFIILIFLFFRVFSVIFQIINISRPKEKLYYEERPVQSNIYFDIMKDLKNIKENYPNDYSELNNIKSDDISDLINIENLEVMLKKFMNIPENDEKNRCCANCNLKKKVD